MNEYQWSCCSTTFHRFSVNSSCLKTLYVKLISPVANHIHNVNTTNTQASLSYGCIKWNYLPWKSNCYAEKKAVIINVSWDIISSSMANLMCSFSLIMRFVLAQKHFSQIEYDSSIFRRHKCLKSRKFIWWAI